MCYLTHKLHKRFGKSEYLVIFAPRKEAPIPLDRLRERRSKGQYRTKTNNDNTQN